MANTMEQDLTVLNKAFDEMDKTFLYAIDDKPVNSMKTYLIKDFNDFEDFNNYLMEKYKNEEDIPPLKVTFLEDIEGLLKGNYILNLKLADDYFPDPLSNISNFSGGGSGVELGTVLSELNTDKYDVMTTLIGGSNYIIDTYDLPILALDVGYNVIKNNQGENRTAIPRTKTYYLFQVENSLQLQEASDTNLPTLSLNFNNFNPQFHFHASNDNVLFYFGDGTDIAGKLVAGNGISLNLGSNNELAISATNTFIPSTQLSVLNNSNYTIANLATPLPNGYWLRRDDLEGLLGFDLSIRYTGISSTGESTTVTNTSIASLAFSTSDFSIAENQLDTEVGYPRRIAISLNNNQKLNTANIKSNLYSSTIPTVSSAADLAPSSTTTEPITYVVAGEIQENSSNRTPLFSLGSVSVYSGAEIYFPVRNTTNCYAFIMGPLNGDFAIVRYNNGNWSGKQISSASPEK